MSYRKISNLLKNIEIYWKILKIFNNETGLAEPGAGFCGILSRHLNVTKKVMEKYGKYLIMNRLWRAEGCPDPGNVEIHIYIYMYIECGMHGYGSPAQLGGRPRAVSPECTKKIII